MSKIPYRFNTPIPIDFWKTGYLNPKNRETYFKRLSFLTWAFSKCSVIEHKQTFFSKEITLSAYEFIFGRIQAAQECGLTEQEFRTQLSYFIKNGYLQKTTNSITNKISSYKWVTSRFAQTLSSQNNQLTTKTTNCLTNNQPTEKPSVLREETPKFSRPKQPTNNQLPNHSIKKRTIELSLLKNDNKNDDRESSFSHKNTPIAFFDPKKYRLRDGQFLSLRTQNAFCKYRGRELQKLIANVQYYEEFCDSGGVVKTTHERFLQYCLNNDMAQKQELIWQNDLLARYKKEELKLNNLEIKKTVIVFHNKTGEAPTSISKELPINTFANILEKYISCQESAYATGY